MNNNTFDKSINNINLSFSQFLKQYKKDKHIYKQKKLGENILYFKYKCKNIDNIFLQNKTQCQKEIINLYETYLYNKLGYNRGWNNYNMHINELNESLIMSYNYDIIFNKFKEETGVSDVYIEFLDNYYSITKEISIILYLDEYEEFKDNINRFIYKCGYFISLINKDTEENTIQLQIEPKYIVELTSYDESKDLIYDKENKNIKNKCNGILYHMTLGKYYNKIKNIGLIPKAKNKKSKHPERIYFYQSNKLPFINNTYFLQQAHEFYKQNGKYISDVQNYLKDGKLEIIILKIDLYKYSQLKYRFFQDPNHPQGIFTYEPVHPICVDLYDTFYI